MSRQWLLSTILWFGLVFVVCSPLINEPAPPASPTTQLSEIATANTPDGKGLVSSPTPPVKAALSLRERVEAGTIVLYTTQREVDPFPLLAWPELAVLNRPEFKDIYGQSPGASPLVGDMIPQLNATGNFLMIPGLAVEPDERGAGTWLVNLNRGDVRQLWNKGVVTAWSPDGTQFAYVENNTLYLEKAEEDGQAVDILTAPELWEHFVAWSPDGAGVAALGAITGPASADGSAPPITGTVWLASPQGGPAKQLEGFPILPTWYSRRQFQWSPDGSALLVGVAHPQRIITLSGHQYLFEDGSSGLAWVPQLTNLLVQKPEGLFITDQHGQAMVQVTDQVVAGWAFSADGRYLAYSYPATENKSPDVFVFELAGQKIVWSSSRPEGVNSPLTLQWTPDGEALIIDDGDYQTPIWAAALEPGSRIEALIEPGLLITVIPRPATLTNP